MELDTERRQRACLVGKLFALGRRLTDSGVTQGLRREDFVLDEVNQFTVKEIDFAMDVAQGVFILRKCTHTGDLLRGSRLALVEKRLQANNSLRGAAFSLLLDKMPTAGKMRAENQLILLGRGLTGKTFREEASGLNAEGETAVVPSPLYEAV